MGWMPAAQSLVALGLQVFVLLVSARGRAGTVFSVRATKGLVDRCNLRLDGAEPKSDGWCLAKTLGEVGPQPGNPRVKLPSPLDTFRPGRKGLDRQFLFRLEGC